MILTCFQQFFFFIEEEHGVIYDAQNVVHLNGALGEIVDREQEPSAVIGEILLPTHLRVRVRHSNRFYKRLGFLL